MFACEHGKESSFSGTVSTDKVPAGVCVYFPVDILQDLLLDW